MTNRNWNKGEMGKDLECFMYSNPFIVLYMILLSCIGDKDWYSSTSTN